MFASKKTQNNAFWLPCITFSPDLKYFVQEDNDNKYFENVPAGNPSKSILMNSITKILLTKL